MPESKDKADSITTDEEEETQSYCGSKDEMQVMNKTQRKDKRLESSEESTNEEQNDTETEGNGGDSPKKAEKNKVSTLMDKETAGQSPSHEKETPQSDEDGDGDDTSSDDGDKGDDSNITHTYTNNWIYYIWSDCCVSQCEAVFSLSRKIL